MAKIHKRYNRRQNLVSAGPWRFVLVAVFAMALDLLIDGELDQLHYIADWVAKSSAFETATPTSSSAPAARRPTYDMQGRVVRVFDGDSILLQVATDEVMIRLHGIDSPEKDQPYGRAARRALNELVGDDVVGVKVKDTDDYGRTVAVVYDDETNVNLEMVRRGYAWWYRRYAKSDGALRRAEEAARADALGLWRGKDPVAPWEWRRRSN